MTAVVKGFHVVGLWPAGPGALVVSVMSRVVTVQVSDSGKAVVLTRRS